MDFSKPLFLGNILFLLNFSDVNALFIVDLAFLLVDSELVFDNPLLNLALDLHLEEFSCLTNLLAVVGLQVLEEGLRADCHSSDLYCLKPDAPALNHIEHLGLDRLCQLLTVGDHLVD